MARGKLDPSELYKLKALQGVSLESVEGMLETCEVKTLEVGELLLKFGQPNTRMYMILSGQLSVHLESPDSEPVAILDAGETVGELSVIDNRPASAYVVAAAPARLLAVDEARFWNLVNASHDFAINLLLSLAARLRSNNTTVSSNIRLQREYKRNAMIDGLTTLYNRRWLDEALPRFVTRYGRGEQPLTIVIVDVDHFKSFNDTYGHPVGDQVLVEVAKTLLGNIRPADLVARYGGEEFLVILPDTDAKGGRIVAERLRTAVSQIRLGPPAGRDRRITISCGGASLRAGEPLAELIAHADQALYQAKHSGRNRVSFLDA
jgi:diguanylate cyclase (GGDEF)-like protein